MPKACFGQPQKSIRPDRLGFHVWLTGRNQVWVADITCIRTQEAFMYLGLITDKWSRKIVGFDLGETLETRSVLKTLAMALRGLKPRQRPSRRGSPDCG